MLRRGSFVGGLGCDAVTAIMETQDKRDLVGALDEWCPKQELPSSKEKTRTNRGARFHFPRLTRCVHDYRLTHRSDPCNPAFSGVSVTAFT